MTILLFSIGILMGKSFAAKETVTVLGASSSSKTIILNIGHFDELKPGTKAMLFSEKPMGRVIAQAIKTFARKSVWSLGKKSKLSLKKGQVLRIILPKFSKDPEQKEPLDLEDEDFKKLSEKINQKQKTRTEETVSRFKKLWELGFTYHYNFEENEETTDTVNSSSNKFDFGLHGRIYLAQWKEWLKRFVWDINYRYAFDTADLGSQTGILKESTLGTSLEYYFFNKPTEVEKNLFFVGLGLRYGFSTIETSGGASTGDYKSLSLPYLTTGWGYTLKDHWGLRLEFVYASPDLSLDSTNSTIDLPAEVSYSELKLGGGLSYFF